MQVPDNFFGGPIDLFRRKRFCACKNMVVIFFFMFSFHLFASDSQHIKILADCPLPKGVTIKGRIVESVSWEDKEGMHFLVISEYKQGAFMEPGWKSEIHAAMYLQSSDTLRRIWKIQDFAKDGEEAKYMRNSLTVHDVDGDGLAETGFYYGIFRDGLDPDNLKYMLHTKGVKLAVRGLIPKDEEDFAKYDKAFDPAFNSCSGIFKDFASTEWDQFVRLNFDVFKGTR